MKGKDSGIRDHETHESGERETRSTERRARPRDPEASAEIDIAYIDDLTGLLNRRFVNRLIQEDWEPLLKRHGELSLILIDLDGFKEVNDRYGHSAGDEVLRVVARLLRKNFRAEDFVARYGGDEFLVMLLGAGQSAASDLAARGRAAVDATNFSTPDGERIAVPLSFSMGIASSPVDGVTGAAALEAADRRLYKEKRGRSGAQRSSITRLLLASLGLATILAIGVALWPRSRQTDPVETPAARPMRRSIAVLGFKNLSGRTEAAWLSTAFVEMLSAELAVVGTLRVIPGESVARARADLALTESDTFAEDTLRRVHARLGSDIVVVGSYLELPGSNDSRIRLDVRLQDAAGGEAIGVVSQTGTASELIDLVAKTGAQLRQMLGAAPLAPNTAATITASQPGTTEAARLYAEGLVRLRMFDALHARELLERAAKADPDWPLVHSVLAEAWAALGYDSRAQDAAHHAFELSAKLPREERLLVEARYREATAEWTEAIRIYDTLFHFAPDNVDYGLSLARVKRLSGKDADARATLTELRRLPKPLSGDPRIDLAEAETAQDLAKTRDAAKRAGDQARAQGARLFLAKARLLEAWALGELGQYVTATSAAEEARQIYVEAGDRGGLARALSRLATVRPNQADLLSARALFEESVRLAREVGDRRFTALVLNNLALTYSDAGDLAGARPIYEESLAIAREIGAKRAITIVLNNLGRDLNNMGRPQDGRRLLQEALEGYRALGDRGSEVYALNNLGNSAVSLGDLAEAQRLYEEALPISHESGEQRIRGYTLLDLAEVQYWRGDFAGTRKWYEQSLALRRRLDLKLDIADSQLGLARLALAEKDPRTAESLAREAAAVYEKEKSASAYWAHSLLAQALIDQDRARDAETALSRASAAAAQTQQASIRLAIRIAEGRVLAASNRAWEALKILESAIAEANRMGLIPESYEARLALGEAQWRFGQREKADGTLSALARDAKKRGFELIVRRTVAATKTAGGQMQ